MKTINTTFIDKMHLKGFKYIVLFVVILSSLNASSQNPNWIYGNKLIHFSNAGITTSPLPQPGANPLLHYTGQVPTKGQNCQFDNQGNLLFFIIDGNIYDKDGYVIALYNEFASIGGLPFMSCFFDDIAITNVPGYCDKFYLFYTVQSNISSTRSVVLGSILDMAIQNPNFPNSQNRKGSLLIVDDSGPFSYFFEANSTNGINQFSAYATEFAGISGSKVYPNSFELIELSDSHKILIISSLDDGMKVFDFTPNAINLLNNNLMVNTGATNTEHSCVKSCALSNGSYLIASTTPCLTAQTGANYSSFFIHNFNVNIGVAFQQEIQLPYTSDDPVIGFEFSPDGTKLWFTKLLAPKIGVIDLASGVISYPLNADLLNYSAGEIESQIDETGTPVLYFSSQNGLYKLTNPNSPNSANLSAVSWANGIPSCTVSSGNIPGLASIYTLQVQNTGSGIIQNYLAAANCCHDFVVIHDDSPTQITTALDGNWSNGQNPFSNQNSPIKIINNLTFQSGTITHIYNMIFEFDVNANVIIEKGAQVFLHGTTWTSMTCKNIMWPGVDLLGTTNSSNSIDQIPIGGGDQGYLYMTNSVIENAMIGVDVGGINSVASGGVIRAIQSSFRNNCNDVIFRKYHYQIGGNYIQNKSYFKFCSFVTDQHLNDPNLSPNNHIYLIRVDKVSFVNCSFMNKTDINTYNWFSRGRGIYSAQASFSVIGSNDPWSMSPTDISTTFYKLSYGILSYGFNSPLSFYKCAKNEFQFCLYGIVNNNTDNVQIYLNNFTLPDAAGFTSNNTVERGIYLTNSTGYVVEQNFFDGSNDPGVNDSYPCAMGVWVNNSGDDANEIRNNDFDEMRLGTYVTGENIDFVPGVNSTYLPGQDQSGLQLFCNTYSNGKTDIFRDSNTTMRWVQGGNQGTEVPGTNTEIIPAGNRFSSDDCSGVIQDFVCDPNNIYHIDYWCNTNANAVPDCGGVSSITASELLTSAPLPSFGAYSESDCPNHFTGGGNSPGPGIIASTEAQIAQITNELNIAKASYQQVVDKNQKIGTIDVLNEVFPHESQFYRDLLIQRFPLSDEVLRQVIVNANRLNPWHLTEIFLANSPLKKDVLAEIVDAQILNGFFLNFLFQADAGLSLRTVMELNITGLATERDKLIQQLAHEGMNYETDIELESDQVIYSNPYLNQLESNQGLVHLRSRASYLSSLGLYNDAITLIADEPLLDNLSVILSMANDLGGNWNSADTSQIETLYAISNDLTDFSSGIARGILDEIGDSLVEPEPNFPIQQRSLMNNENSSDPVLPLLGIYPNPAKDLAYIHYPIEADEHGFIRVLDVDGRLIESINPNSNGLLEFSVSNYKSGIYILELVAFDKIVESVKLVVIK